MNCNIWRVAVRPSYIEDARFLKLKGSSSARHVLQKILRTQSNPVQL